MVNQLYQFDFVMRYNYIELFFARLKEKLFSIALVMVYYFYKNIVKKKRYNATLQD